MKDINPQKEQMMDNNRTLTPVVGVLTDVLEELTEDTTEHLLLEPGNVLKLRCDLSTRPGMAINWYKEGSRVLPTPRVQIRGPIMEIADVTYEDSGIYACVLRGHKEPMRNFTINVAGQGNKQTPALFAMNAFKIYTN